MLNNCLEIFESEYEKKGERFILDNYELSSGTYRVVLIGRENLNIVDTVDISKTKKDEEQWSGIDPDLYYDLKFYDYHSKLLEMNKPIDPKKTIHSNNFMSFSVKKNSIAEGKVNKEAVDRYFDVLKEPLSKYKKGKTADIYKDFEDKNGAPDIEMIDRIREYILTGKCWEDIDCEKKDYLKIFFVLPDKKETQDIYIKESERYLIPNLYNSNDYNILIEDKIWGMPNNNIGMNSKKPYLANKTRKIETPYLLDQNRAKMHKMFFDYLSGNAARGKTNIYFEDDEDRKRIIPISDADDIPAISNGYYLRLSIGKAGAEIKKYDTITNNILKAKDSFTLKNFFSNEKEIEKSKLPYWKETDNMQEIKYLIDAIFFNGYLKNNFFTEVKDIKVNDEIIIKRCILESRDILHSWFYAGQSMNADTVLRRISSRLIKSSLCKEKGTYEARRRLNLRWSLLDHFNGDERMWKTMSDVREMLRKHINSDEEWQFEDDNELSYAIGQAVRFLVGKSKADMVPESVINQFIDSRNVENIKGKLRRLYRRYNYNMNALKPGRDKQLIGHIMRVQPDEFKIEPDYVEAGFLDNSLVYETKIEK